MDYIRISERERIRSGGGGIGRRGFDRFKMRWRWVGDDGDQKFD